MKNGEIKVQRLNQSDISTFQQLIVLFQEVFESENRSIPSKDYLLNLISQTDFIAFVVEVNNELVGGLTAYELKKYYTEASEYFIYDIAIDPVYQRQGLGGKLITALKAYGTVRGIKEIFVAAVEEEIQAVNFYQSTGGEGEKVVHFSYNTET